MAFQHLEWLFVAVPALVLLLIWRFWRRRYWSHSLVAHFGEEIGGAHLIVRLPRILEAAAIGLLLVALLGPVYPFTQTRVERCGLQIMFVVDLSQSMEEPLLRGAAPPSDASSAAERDGRTANQGTGGRSPERLSDALSARQQACLGPRENCELRASSRQVPTRR